MKFHGVLINFNKILWISNKVSMNLS